MKQQRLINSSKVATGGFLYGLGAAIGAGVVIGVIWYGVLANEEDFSWPLWVEAVVSVGILSAVFAGSLFRSQEIPEGEWTPPLYAIVIATAAYVPAFLVPGTLLTAILFVAAFLLGIAALMLPGKPTEFSLSEPLIAFAAMVGGVACLAALIGVFAIDYNLPEVGASTANSANCSPEYEPCVPVSDSDLDCVDVGHSVTVVGVDIYGLDANSDGEGCEWW